MNIFERYKSSERPRRRAAVLLVRAKADVDKATTNDGRMPAFHSGSEWPLRRAAGARACQGGRKATADSGAFVVAQNSRTDTLQVLLPRQGCTRPTAFVLDLDRQHPDCARRPTTGAASLAGNIPFNMARRQSSAAAPRGGCWRSPTATSPAQPAVTATTKSAQKIERPSKVPLRPRQHTTDGVTKLAATRILLVYSYE